MKKFFFPVITLIISLNSFADIPPAFVEVTPVKKQLWQPSIQASGIIHASNSAKITSEISGRITKKNFQDGSVVKKGSVLFELNADVLKAQLQLDQANLKLSKLQFSRKNELIKINAISAAELDTAKTILQTDEAKVVQAKAALDKALIKAPFSGKVGFSGAGVGDYISAGQVLVNLQMTDLMSLQLSIPEVYSNKIRVGQKAVVWSDVYVGHQFQGKITEIDVEINQKNQSIIAKTTIPNPNNILMPGSFMNAKILIGEEKPILTIPQACIQYQKEGPYVYKSISGKAHKTSITLGSQLNNEIVVLSGLKETDHVVSEGHNKLSEGSPIIVANQQAKKAS